MDGYSRLDEHVLAGGQVTATDIERLASAGIRLIVCNRPDGEALFGQTSSRRLAEIAAAHGVAWLDLPIRGADATPEQAQAFADAVEHAGGTVVAYCRIGMRSALLWAMARVARGADTDATIAAAANAGFDLSPLRDRIAQLAGGDGA